MQITDSLGTALNLTRHNGQRGAKRAADEPVRASVPALIEPAAPSRALSPSLGGRSRPVAAVLAQLVATAEDLPATRGLRREEPSVGAEVYRRVAHLAPEPSPREARIV